jgi:hypothetical protein
MIHKDEAQAIAYAHINKSDLYWKDKPEMVVTEVVRHKLGWLFYWTSSHYLETHSISDALAGNGPILVSETTGYLEEVGTAPPIEERIEEATIRLSERIKRAPKEEPMKGLPKEGKIVYRLWDSSAIPVSVGSSDDEGRPFPIGWVLLWIIIVALIGLCLWIIL